MTFTLLLDLDDTLLGNNTDIFIPAYTKALADDLSHLHPPELLIEKLFAAVRLMIENRSPARTLKQVFDTSFYPAIGVQEAAARWDIERFYEQVYPGLKSLTHPNPAAFELVEQAAARGMTMAIATNPLFPLTAILQRIAWARLDPNCFRLITSYENFHFAKPNPAYFAEILGLLGCPEGPVVMVGNNPKDDIAAAQAAGLATFWVNDTIRELDDSRHASGTLADVLTWIDRRKPEELLPNIHHYPGSLAVVRSTPAVLSELTDVLPADDWTQKPAPDSWAPVEILCHLRDVDRDVNLGRIESVLSSENPFLPGADTDVWADERIYICQNGPQAWHEFLQARIELLEFLTPIQAEDWQRTARHAIFGPTDLTELIYFIAGHDQLHIRQMVDALEKVTT